jgi:hypothetical protein
VLATQTQEDWRAINDASIRVHSHATAGEAVV